jgi:signal transduction histidine kinase
MNNEEINQKEKLEEEIKHLVRTEKRLYEITAKYDKEILDLKKTNNLYTKFNKIYNIEDVCSVLCKDLVEEFNYENVIIYIKREESEYIKLESSCIDENAIKIHAAGIIKELVIEKAAKIISDDDSNVYPILKNKFLLKQFIIAPLLDHNAIIIGFIIGGFSIANELLFSKYTEEDKNTFANVAAYVSNTIEKINLINSIKLLEKDKYYMIGVLSSGISHQILNPLTGIKGTFDFVVSEIDCNGLLEKKDLKEAIGIIYSEIDRIKDIIKNIRMLIYGKEAIEVFNFYDVTKSIVDVFKKSIADRVEFIVDVDISLTIKSNINAISHILMNTISNAIDAIENKCGVVKIKARASKKSFWFEISDNGSGIEEQNMSKLYNIDFTTKNVLSGTGFGLYLVKEMASKYGLQIEVQSTINVGTKIKFIKL